MNLIKAPESIPKKPQRPLLFLAGSIEMGTASNWQDRVAAALDGLTCSLLNPRRDDWDSSWVQRKDNPQFRAQVEWELQAQEQADCILMYFDPKTRSPITLLELGLFGRPAKRREVVVCCPDGFWRKGNVDIVCERYEIRQVVSLDALIGAAKDFCSSFRAW